MSKPTIKRPVAKPKQQEFLSAIPEDPKFERSNRLARYLHASNHIDDGLKACPEGCRWFEIYGPKGAIPEAEWREFAAKNGVFWSQIGKSKSPPIRGR